MATIRAFEMTAMANGFMLSPAKRRSRFGRGLFLSALVLWLSAPADAGEVYFARGWTNGIMLLMPPPEPDSDEQAADLASARAVFRARTPAEEARAVKQASLSFYNFAPAIGPSFVPGRYPQLEKLFLTVRTNITEAIDIPKDHWQRQRPYELDETLQFGRPERCPSYPSGHAARGVVQSFLLAELFPDKREAILAIGREIGWDRVLIGKHFPTDIAAGRVLGKAIVRELMANPTFQRDWAAVKAEVKAVRQTENHAN